MVFKFGLSRKHEYMADAGAAEMTRNPRALASALQKISRNHEISTVKSDNLSEMFIDNKLGSAGFLGALGGLFTIHPSIEKRIKVLEEI
jgi:heat shock protein HtpX